MLLLDAAEWRDGSDSEGTNMALPAGFEHMLL